MNTRMMKKHLEKCGISFEKSEDGWDAFMEGDLIRCNPYLGDLVWEVANDLGEN